jgi:UDP-N-acetylglucosamine 2-epimerase (non-hydrolysing)
MFVIVAGTRPEIIKLAPVYFEFKKRKIDIKWIHSGQHNCETYEFFKIVPDEILHLDRKQNTLSELTSLLLDKLSKSNLFLNAGSVLVHGDTTTAFTASLVAFYNNKKIIHIESGLRTYKKDPFPEEKNREIISRLADMHFSPTENAKSNLIKEGIKSESIFVVGNTIVDATLFAKSQVQEVCADKLVLVTAHRRENWETGISNICKALNLIGSTHRDIKILFPVHPNPLIRKIVQDEIIADNISIVNPLNYGEMIRTISNAWLVLTDSGGIQEECVTLQKPVLVLRETTERDEVIKLGAGVLVGTNINKICEFFNRIYKQENFYKSMQIGLSDNPYGNGKSSQSIVEIIMSNNITS